METILAPEKRVLFISKELIGADLAYRLKKEGCKVKLFIEAESDKQCFDGMVEKTANWEAELGWVGKDGLIVFDDVGYGTIQDDLRAKGYLVIGGSADGDKLELDREYGQKILKDSGVQVSKDFKTLHFTPQEAIDYIETHQGSWVIKHNTHNTSFTYVSVLEDGSDAIDVLTKYEASKTEGQEFSIQKKVTGVELAVGRFFNGNNWSGPIIINREHKHLCNDDIGPLGGETGTLMWYETNENNRLFQETLGKLELQLQKSNYKGYVDVNCIIPDQSSVYPLEITSRFGSCTNQLQSEIQISKWYDFFCALAKGEEFNLEYKTGFGINVALTTPPFPYRIPGHEFSQQGTRIFFKETLTDNEINSLHFEDVAREAGANNSYYIAGNSGYILYITGIGETVEEARESVYSLIKKIHIPKMFYRTDIGLPFMNKDYTLLKTWGWI